MDINERDWKLFRKYLPDWQENYMERLDEAEATTKLPDNPDMEKVEKFVERINRIAVNEEF